MKTYEILKNQPRCSWQRPVGNIEAAGASLNVMTVCGELTVGVGEWWVSNKKRTTAREAVISLTKKEAIKFARAVLAMAEGEAV